MYGFSTHNLPLSPNYRVGVNSSNSSISTKESLGKGELGEVKSTLPIQRPYYLEERPAIGNVSSNKTPFNGEVEWINYYFEIGKLKENLDRFSIESYVQLFSEKPNLFLNLVENGCFEETKNLEIHDKILLQLPESCLKVILTKENGRLINWEFFAKRVSAQMPGNDTALYHVIKHLNNGYFENILGKLPVQTQSRFFGFEGVSKGVLTHLDFYFRGVLNALKRDQSERPMEKLCLQKTNNYLAAQFQNENLPMKLKHTGFAQELYAFILRQDSELGSDFLKGLQESGIDSDFSEAFKKEFLNHCTLRDGDVRRIQELMSLLSPDQFGSSLRQLAGDHEDCANCISLFFSSRSDSRVAVASELPIGLAVSFIRKWSEFTHQRTLTGQERFIQKGWERIAYAAVNRRSDRGVFAATVLENISQLRDEKVANLDDVISSVANEFLIERAGNFVNPRSDKVIGVTLLALLSPQRLTGFKDNLMLRRVIQDYFSGNFQFNHDEMQDIIRGILTGKNSKPRSGYIRKKINTGDAKIGVSKVLAVVRPPLWARMIGKVPTLEVVCSNMNQGTGVELMRKLHTQCGASVTIELFKVEPPKLGNAPLITTNLVVPT